MPIKIPDSLPARATLEGENIFVMTEYRAIHQDVRPLSLLILNLMPTKIVTETQLLRKLSNSPLQVEVELLQTASHISQNTDADHLSSFYTTFEEIQDAFGKRVTELVASETELKRAHLPAGETWMQRKQESVSFLQRTQDMGVKMLYLGDKLSNIRAISREFARQGDALWQRFNQKDPEKHHWYYRSICDAISDLSDHAAWQEFDRLICETFNEGASPKGV